MLLVVAFVLAIFYLPSPWGLVAVGTAAVLELAEWWFWWWLSRRRAPAIGLETMIGSTATAVTPLRPAGQVRAQGELWQATCAAGADAGDVLDVVAVEGLTLVVEPRVPGV